MDTKMEREMETGDINDYVYQFWLLNLKFLNSNPGGGPCFHEASGDGLAV